MEMSVLFVVLASISVLLCIATVVMILLQKKRDAGFGGSVTGQGGAQRDAYYDANKGRTFEGMLERYTKVAFVLILVITVLITIVQPTPEIILPEFDVDFDTDFLF